MVVWIFIETTRANDKAYMLHYRQKNNNLTIHNVCEHTACAQAAIKQYNIKDSVHIFNIDESGITFKFLCCTSLRKGVGRSSKHIYHLEITTKRNWDRVTSMYVFSAAGKAYSLGVVLCFLKQRARYCYVSGSIQTLRTYLLCC